MRWLAHALAIGGLTACIALLILVGQSTYPAWITIPAAAIVVIGAWRIIKAWTELDDA